MPTTPPQTGGSIGDFITAPIYTPGDVRLYQNKVGAEIHALWIDVLQETRDGTGKVPEKHFKAFQRFVAEWDDFYAKSESYLSRIFDGVLKMTEDYERKLVEWRRTFSSLGTTVTGPEPTPPAPDKPSNYDETIKTVAIVAGLGAVAWLVSSLAKMKTSSKSST